jgi:transcriptional regulator with XRE-family HTH domain
MGWSPKIRKTTERGEVHKLCLAVRKVRAAAGWSQEAMGRHTGLALQTIYRFEAGKQIPRDYGVLTRLRDCAIALGLTEEANLFDYELSGWRTMWNPNGPNPLTPVVREGRSPEQHRLGIAAEKAVTFFPDAKLGAEKALVPVLELYDEAYKAVVRWNTVYDAEFYRSVEAKLDEVIKQKLLHKRKKKTQAKHEQK